MREVARITRKEIEERTQSPILMSMFSKRLHCLREGIKMGKLLKVIDPITRDIIIYEKDINEEDDNNECCANRS